MVGQECTVLQPLVNEVGGHLGPGNEAQHPIRPRRERVHGERPSIDAQQPEQAERRAQRRYEACERPDGDGNGQGREAGEEGEGVVERRKETVEVRG